MKSRHLNAQVVVVVHVPRQPKNKRKKNKKKYKTKQLKVLVIRAFCIGLMTRRKSERNKQIAKSMAKKSLPVYFQNVGK